VPGSSWSSKSARISISISLSHLITSSHTSRTLQQPCRHFVFVSSVSLLFIFQSSPVQRVLRKASRVSQYHHSHHHITSHYIITLFHDHIITSHHQCTWLLWLGLRVLRVPLFYWLSVYLSGRSSEPPCGCGVAHWNEIRRLISIYRTSLIIVLLCAAVCWLVSACPFRVVVHFFYFPVIPNLRQAKPNHQTSTMLLKKYLSI
jgi:hypothetical protein